MYYSKVVLATAYMWNYETNSRDYRAAFFDIVKTATSSLTSRCG